MYRLPRVVGNMLVEITYGGALKRSEERNKLVASNTQVIAMTAEAFTRLWAVDFFPFCAYMDSRWIGVYLYWSSKTPPVYPCSKVCGGSPPVDRVYTIRTLEGYPS